MLLFLDVNLGVKNTTLKVTSSYVTIFRCPLIFYDLPIYNFFCFFDNFFENVWTVMDWCNSGWSHYLGGILGGGIESLGISLDCRFIAPLPSECPLHRYFSHTSSNHSLVTGCRILSQTPIYVCGCGRDIIQ